MDDQSVLVATYEGEHNHPQPSQIEATSSLGRGSVMNLGSVPSSASLSSSLPTTNVSLDLTNSNSIKDSKNTETRKDLPKVPQNLVDHMANSLTTDPNFRAALVAAISGRLMHKN